MSTINKVIGAVIALVGYVLFGGVCFFIGWLLRAAKERNKK